MNISESNELSDRILQMVGELLTDAGTAGGEVDLAPIFDGLACAFVSTAVFTGGTAYAKSVLSLLLEQLDNPEAVSKIMQGVPQGGTA